MATSTSQSATMAQPANIPLHSSSHEPHEASISSSKRSTVPVIAIPDRRRNSFGESMHSPCETWRPDLNRTQSWNAEDLKRAH
ncbi:hypothetical protein BGZ60DRAFT_345432, partial [Tricladium varicosporioides]